MRAETIHALLCARAAAHPDKQAIVGDDDALSYAELDARSMARAAWLVSRGVNKGHRVGLQMPNGVAWAVDAFAVMRMGAVLVPLNTLLRPPELQAQLALAGVRWLIARARFRGRDYLAEFADIERATLPSLRDVWWQHEQAGGMKDASARAQAADQAVAPNAVAVARALAERVLPADDIAVLFTSGSSGAPKGVIHTHGGAIRANAAGLAARCIRADSRLYLPMPFFWAGGFAGGLLSALNAGATLLTEAQPEAGRTLAFLARERASLFRGWPDQAEQLAAHPQFAATDLSALQPGSLDAVLPPTLRAAPGSRANLFGMTETFGPYCGYALDEVMPRDKWGSCGRPFEGMRLRIVDPDSGALLLAGETGHIQVGGRNLLRGICGREREDIFTVDGWYDTGDCGHLDGDGFLYFEGRADDMIKVSGATVYPAEIEAALETIPGVARAFVTALALDGMASAGMGIGAAVVCDAALPEQQLVEHARSRLSAFKIPSRWIILDSLEELPRTVAGKLDKAALRSLLLSAAPDALPNS